MLSKTGKTQWNPIQEVFPWEKRDGWNIMDSEMPKDFKIDSDTQPGAGLYKPFEIPKENGENSTEIAWWEWENQWKSTIPTWKEAEKLYNPETPAWKIRGRMAEIYDTEEWGNYELLEAQLSTTQWRNENTKQAESLFFNPTSLNASFWNIDAKKRQENIVWFNANTKWDGPLQDSFQRIEWNFVLPEDLKDKSLQELYNEDPQNFETVNEALSLAILLELESNVLDGKMNYPKETVERLKGEIQDRDTSPFEKLKKFWEIYTLVETSDGQFGNKEKNQRLAKQKLVQNWKLEDFYRLQGQVNKAKEEQNSQKEKEFLRELDTLYKNCDLSPAEIESLWWWQLDIASETISETPQKAA